MVKYRITLKDNITGFQRTFEEEYNMSDEGVEFIWDEGNYACDCNRVLFLYGFDSEIETDCFGDRIELIELTKK